MVRLRIRWLYAWLIGQSVDRWLRPSVGTSLRSFVGPSVRLSVGVFQTHLRKETSTNWYHNSLLTPPQKRSSRHPLGKEGHQGHSVITNG